jgi:hypothetical protein
LSPNFIALEELKRLKLLAKFTKKSLYLDQIKCEAMSTARKLRPKFDNLLVGDWRRSHAQKKQKSAALEVNGDTTNPRYRLRPLPAAPLFVRRSYFSVVLRPLSHEHWGPKLWASEVLFCLLATEACQKNECGALVVNGRIINPRRCLKPIPEAPLIVHRRSSIVVPKPLARCTPQVFGRGVQADARGAAQVLDRVAQAVARGSARRKSQILHRRRTTRQMRSEEE